MRRFRERAVCPTTPMARCSSVARHEVGTARIPEPLLWEARWRAKGARGEHPFARQRASHRKTCLVDSFYNHVP